MPEKTDFPNPINAVAKKASKSPWDFTSPPYDERTSCFQSAGDHYGVGHRQPIGHTEDPKTSSPMLPFGRVKTMKIDEKG